MGVYFVYCKKSRYLYKIPNALPCIFNRFLYGDRSKYALSYNTYQPKQVLLKGDLQTICRFSYMKVL